MGLAYETTRSWNIAVIAFAIMAVTPAHTMRSVAGGFDNESVAVAALCSTFYFWVASLRSPKMWWLGAVAGVAYINMVAAWGAYVALLVHSVPGAQLTQRTLRRLGEVLLSLKILTDVPYFIFTLRVQIHFCAEHDRGSRGMHAADASLHCGPAPLILPILRHWCVRQVLPSFFRCNNLCFHVVVVPHTDSQRFACCTNK